MPYKLIKGEFHIFYPDNPRQGPEPDGDTLKFRPDNPALVEALRSPGGSGPRFNRKGMVNLRFEGIDALETHFDDMHQHLGFAEAARDSVLRQAGFGQVTFWDDLPFKVKTVEHHPRRGYVHAKDLDPHGRVIAFVYAGDSSDVDGSEVFVDAATAEQSFNAQLLVEGLVYPAFYSTLPIDLKDRLAALAVAARNGAVGLWPQATASVDQSAAVSGLDALQDLVIWPKLFRRLARFFAGGHSNLSGFDAWLRADPRDRDDRLLLPNRELGNMHDVIEVTGNRIRMTERPEDLIVVPDDFVLGGGQQPGGQTQLEEKSVRILAALANPAGPERGNETVTLLNATPEAVDLTGWEIADRANGRQTLDGSLAAGDARRVTLTAQVPLGNRGDTITLFDATGRQIDQVSYTRDQARRQGWTIVF